MGKEQKESPANVLVDQGLNQYLQDNFDKAVTLWKSALKLDPKNSRAQQFLDQAETENRVGCEREVKATCATFEAITPKRLKGPSEEGEEDNEEDDEDEEDEEDEEDDEFADFVDDLSDHAASPLSPRENLDFDHLGPTKPVQKDLLEEQLEQLRPLPGASTSYEVDELTPTHLVKLEFPPDESAEDFTAGLNAEFEGEERTPTHLVLAARPAQNAPALQAVDIDLDPDELTPTHLAPSGSPLPKASPMSGQGSGSLPPPHEDLDDLEITISTTDLESERETAEADPLDDIPITLDVAEERPAPVPAEAPRIIRPDALRPPSRGQIIAMDFGTTRSRVAAMAGGKIHVIPLPGGSTDMPSVVGVRKNGSLVVGNAARDMLATDPANVIPFPRRVIGRLYRDPQIAGFLKNLAMHTTEWSNGRVVFHAQGREYTAPQLCAPILQTLRLAAERFLGERVAQVVLTTPLGFNTTQIQALALAAELAGLEVTQFVEEPVAAALANRTDPGFRNLVGVYDFGGGTFDYSVINLQNNRAKVITTAGDTWLGGEDFEENLANVIADNFWRKHQIEVRNSKVQWQRLLVQAEQAKQELSKKPLVNVSLPEAALTSKGQLDIDFPISRTKFVELTRGLIDRSLATCQEALDHEGLKVSDLSAIYLSSGTTLIPAVQDAVVDFFQQVPRYAVPPERAVLLGSLLAARMRKK